MEAKILVVDDDGMMRKMITASLQRFGYEVDAAEGVKPAMKMMKGSGYDILITDKNMPGLDGSKEGGMYLLKYAKKRVSGIEVIMMTGFATIETAIAAMKLGAFDYISKPFSIDDLNEKIVRILEYRSFLNPGDTIRIYRTLHNEILNLLEMDKNSEEEIHELLKSIDRKIDHFFRSQKEWEKIILIQKEALGKISSYAEQLKEYPGLSEESMNLLNSICKESNRRV